MLNQETKQKIDSARNILVGKVPDPKAQVEQITTALIYKFMDDMDKEAQELGGKARFFTNGYEKYAWTKLMDAKLGGHDRLDLYIEAITSLSQNPHIPQLFRDIFKDTFLPYRNPETLSMFLKEINGFTYDNSEDLGNAFEYLLSVLGSQGDAGQFRTPRHIIDFIVAAVDPKKDETICDPACGTAGFLISAYKHILKQHDSIDDPEKKEKPLTPDERKTLMDHFVGYDISPDMVRLSKVNLYLHGFPSPTIFEYDTLSSEEKWDESFDVMLANPPFMSPKGGIKPHKRFSVQANRSEVLFVDYILEHLRPNGRAGIIVPEGIIFKSETAYKKLRKMLVEDGLLAVVSLPSGVFNPYAGVKTCILLFDKALAKKTKHILFIKISNDGFDLGAQRRQIEKNDLPTALAIIKEYKKAVEAGKDYTMIPQMSFLLDNKQQEVNRIATIVTKEKIAESGDYNLSGDRYKEADQLTNQKWPMVELCKLLDYEQPTKYIVSNENYSDNYQIPVLTAGKTFILGYTNEKVGVFKEDLPVIIFDDFTTATKFVDFPFKVKSSAMKILHAKKEKAHIKFLFYMMQRIKFSSSTHKRYWISQYSKIKIPLPPLEVQKEIVEQIEKYQNIVDGAKQVVVNWKPKIDIDPEWEKVKLGEVCDMFSGLAHEGVVNENGVYILVNSKFISSDGSEYKTSDHNLFPLHVGDVVMVMSDVPNGKTLGKCFYINTENRYTLNQRVCVIRSMNYNQKFLYYYLNRNSYFLSFDNHQSQTNLRKNEVLECPVPVLPLESQKLIVEKIEAERALVEGNKKLIEIYEQKIADVLSEI